MQRTLEWAATQRGSWSLVGFFTLTAVITAEAGNASLADLPAVFAVALAVWALLRH